MNVTLDDLELGIGRATQALIKQQRSDGHWVFELEADATIPSEYVLLRQYLGEPDDLELERKIGAYLRRIQGEHGGCRSSTAALSTSARRSRPTFA